MRFFKKLDFYSSTFAECQQDEEKHFTVLGIVFTIVLAGIMLAFTINDFKIVHDGTQYTIKELSYFQPITEDDMPNVTSSQSSMG